MEYHKESKNGDAKRIADSHISSIPPKRRINRFIKISLTTRDIYKDHYLHKRPLGTPNHVTSKEFREIIDTYCEVAKDELFARGKVQLPYRLGEVKVLKYKLDEHKRAVDWPHFRKTGERKFIDNDHSDGYIYTIPWAVRPYSHKYPVHKFSLSRTIKSDFSQFVKDNPWTMHSYELKIRKKKK